MAYWLQQVAGGTFACPASITVPQSSVDAQVVGDDFCFGKAWTGEGGALFQGDWWNGGVNDLIAAKVVLTDDQISEWMTSGGHRIHGYVLVPLDLLQTRRATFPPCSKMSSARSQTASSSGAAAQISGEQLSVI